MTGAVLVATFTTALYYLAARAEVTRWAWSRYPAALARFFDCAACSGFWYGLGASWGLAALELDVLGVPYGTRLFHAVACALIGLVWTPILAFAQAYGYSQLSAREDDDPTGPGAA